MNARWRKLCLLALGPAAVLLAAGCGVPLSSHMVNGGEPGDTEKTPCPGEHHGFFVCLGADSHIGDRAVEEAIKQGLAKLAELVNSADFQGQVRAAFDQGASIDADLTGADYIVTVTGFCAPGRDVLATAVVGGHAIDWNECRVPRDAAGQPRLADVAGVLLHEITHNLGYTHPPEDPSRTSVPYYLGDLVGADLTAGAKPTTRTD